MENDPKNPLIKLEYSARDKQVWIDFKNQNGNSGAYAIAACYTPEIAKEISEALNQTKKIG